jgi:hypothetical protein
MGYEEAWVVDLLVLREFIPKFGIIFGQRLPERVRHTLNIWPNVTPEGHQKRREKPWVMNQRLSQSSGTGKIVQITNFKCAKYNQCCLRLAHTGWKGIHRFRPCQLYQNQE